MTNISTDSIDANMHLIVCITICYGFLVRDSVNYRKKVMVLYGVMIYVLRRNDGSNCKMIILLFHIFSCACFEHCYLDCFYLRFEPYTNSSR